MASVEKRVRDGRVSWLARWRDPDGRQRKKSFTRKLDAERFLTTVGADMLRGQYIDPYAGRVLVADYAISWVQGRPQRATTRELRERYVRNHIAPTLLGGMRIGDVRHSQVQAWATDRAGFLEPSTLRTLLSLLSSIFASAVMDRLVSESPVQRIRLPREPPSRVVPLSIEQVRVLAEAVPEHCRAMVPTQAGLGLRIGELLGLTFDDVDFLRRVVNVRKQLSRDGRQRIECKTPQSVRAVPLPQFVADELARHIAVHRYSDSELVFTTTRGTGWGQIDYARRLRWAVEASGLPKGTTSHDLRHHYASVLLAAGESVVAVAERLGHDSATLVLTTYGHLLPDSEERTRRVLDDAWRAPDVPQGRQEAL
jgi:integrase